MKYVRGFQW